MVRCSPPAVLSSSRRTLPEYGSVVVSVTVPNASMLRQVVPLVSRCSVVRSLDPCEVTVIESTSGLPSTNCTLVLETSGPTPVVVDVVTPTPLDEPQVVVVPSLTLSGPPPGAVTWVTVRPPTSVVDCARPSCA